MCCKERLLAKTSSSESDQAVHLRHVGECRFEMGPFYPKVSHSTQQRTVEDGSGVWLVPMLLEDGPGVWLVLMLRWRADVSVCAFRVSEAVRIAGSLVFILLLFIFTAVLVKVHMEQDRFFSVTMATIWFINCEWAESGRAGPSRSSHADPKVPAVILSETISFFPPAFGAVLQGSLFGLVGLLPQKYSAIFMSGQGLAGTFAAIAMLLAIGSRSPKPAIWLSSCTTHTKISFLSTFI